ncbi:hypothetical protein ADUPG1_011347, partial [Aduncisulcus paluster]
PGIEEALEQKLDALKQLQKSLRSIKEYLVLHATEEEDEEETGKEIETKSTKDEEVESKKEEEEEDVVSSSDISQTPSLKKPIFSTADANIIAIAQDAISTAPDNSKANLELTQALEARAKTLSFVEYLGSVGRAVVALHTCVLNSEEFERRDKARNGKEKPQGKEEVKVEIRGKEEEEQAEKTETETAKDSAIWAPRSVRDHYYWDLRNSKVRVCELSKGDRHIPIELAYSFDLSGSVVADDPSFDAAQTAINRLSSYDADAGDLIGTCTWGGDVESMLELTDDFDLVAETITDNLTSLSGTDLDQGVRCVAEVFDDSKTDSIPNSSQMSSEDLGQYVYLDKHKKEVMKQAIFISDGEGSFNVNSTYLASVKEKDICINTVCVMCEEDSSAESRMKQIAYQTGGRYVRTNSTYATDYWVSHYNNVALRQWLIPYPCACFPVPPGDRIINTNTPCTPTGVDTVKFAGSFSRHRWNKGSEMIGREDEPRESEILDGSNHQMDSVDQGADIGRSMEYEDNAEQPYYVRGVRMARPTLKKNRRLKGSRTIDGVPVPIQQTMPPAPSSNLPLPVPSHRMIYKHHEPAKTSKPSIRQRLLIRSQGKRGFVSYLCWILGSSMTGYLMFGHWFMYLCCCGPCIGYRYSYDDYIDGEKKKSHSRNIKADSEVKALQQRSGWSSVQGQKRRLGMRAREGAILSPPPSRSTVSHSTPLPPPRRTLPSRQPTPVPESLLPSSSHHDEYDSIPHPPLHHPPSRDFIPPPPSRELSHPPSSSALSQRMSQVSHSQPQPESASSSALSPPRQPAPPPAMSALQMRMKRSQGSGMLH